MIEWFLSYRGIDRDAARAIAVGLEAAGVGVWCDCLPEKLVPGLPWIGQIEEALARCDGYLLLVGAGDLQGWARSELDYALNRHVKVPSFRVVPLLLPEVQAQTLPPFLASYQAVFLGVDPREPGVWSQTLARALQADTLPAQTLPTTEDCPFPGLESFKESQARFLFGRDSDIRALISRLGRTPRGYSKWLQVEGPSGSGKSSVVQAGLIPALRRGWAEGTYREWRIATMRPGILPIRNLARALGETLGDAVSGYSHLIESLEQGPDGLSHLLRRHLRAEDGAGFLLLCDQFEEIFTLGTSEIAQLDKLLASALQDTDLPFFLVTAIRSDFVADLRRLPNLLRLLNDSASRYQLGELDEAGLQDAITGPIGLAQWQVEPGFPESVVHDALEVGHPLPLLGYVLRALWDACAGDRRFTVAAYERVGRLSGSLNRAADAAVDSLAPGQRRVARTLLLSLVQVGRGTSDLSRRVPKEELLAIGGKGAEEVLFRLSGGRAHDVPATAPTLPRLLAIDSIEGVSLIHDAIIDRWATLKAWIDEERGALERRCDLDASATAWAAAGEPADWLPRGTQLQYFQGALNPGAAQSRFLKRAVRAQRRRVIAHGALALAAVAAVMGVAWLAGVSAEIGRWVARLEIEARLGHEMSIDVELDTIGRALGKTFAVMPSMFDWDFGCKGSWGGWTVPYTRT